MNWIFQILHIVTKKNVQIFTILYIYSDTESKVDFPNSAKVLMYFFSNYRSVRCIQRIKFIQTNNPICMLKPKTVPHNYFHSQLELVSHCE